MTDCNETDPFTQTYAALWTLLEDFPPFTEEVAVGNRIKLNKEFVRDPIKETVREGDLPEVILFPIGGETNIHANSSESRLDRNFQLLISTGDKRVTEYHFPLAWHVVQAIADWPKRIGGLTWRGQPFLTDVNLPDTTEGLNDPNANRNIPGWSSVLTIQTVMNFSTALLRKE